VAMPTLPAQGDNPWDNTMAVALADINQKAESAQTDVDEALDGLGDLETVVDGHTATLGTHGTRLTAVETSNALKAADSAVVKLTGNQTIAGTKTFSSAPSVPDNSFSIVKITGLQTALNAKAPLASPSFTGTVSGVTKAMVGLANVNNTADDDKPISNATQTALNAKATTADLNGRITSHNHTGGSDGPNLPISAISGLQTQLNAKEDDLPSSSVGGSAISWDSSDYTIKYFNMVRWGRVVFVTIAFETKFGIGNNAVHGNTSNKIVATITGAPYNDIWKGPSNSHYASVTYPMSAGADGAMCSGYIDADSRQIKLAATVPYNFESGYTFSLNGIYFLNSSA
jgi:hypothetical protein